MDCCEFNRMLDDHENLTEPELKELNAHAAGCEACRAELEFYRSIINTAATIPVPDPPADLIDRVNSRIDSMPVMTGRFDGIRNGVRRNIRRIMTVAACLAVGLIVGLNNKTIKERLTDDRTDGVISTTVTVTDNGGGEIADYEIAVTEEATEAPETIVAEVPVSVQPKPETATAKPVSAPTKPAAAPKPAVAKTPHITSAPAPAATAPTPASAPTAVPVAASDGPAENDTAPQDEPAKSGKTYVIARGNYYIPEAEIETPAPTAAPQSVEITGERYQIAMGSYEITEEERVELKKNKLIVNESDINKIVACMNKAKVRGTTTGYTASSAAFANFLSMLDAEGIYYNYIENTPASGEITFTLLAN